MKIQDKNFGGGMDNFQGTANFIWQVADDILRGNFKQHEYGDVILPFVVLRRLDCVFSPVRDKVIQKLSKNDLLFMLVDKFTEVDLHPDQVDNHEMGYIFEELLRRFSEMSNETAGEHYTPREVIRLMVNLLFSEHSERLKGRGLIRKVFDPACGTGGMLTIAKDHIRTHINPEIEVLLFGQELNPQTFAISKSDMLISGENADNIKDESSLTKDKFVGSKFDFMWQDSAHRRHLLLRQDEKEPGKQAELHP